jgi:hypothetical protein
MDTAPFRSLDNADVIEVEFVIVQGDMWQFKLLVDSVFTGRNNVILGNDATDLMRAQIPAGVG